MGDNGVKKNDRGLYRKPFGFDSQRLGGLEVRFLLMARLLEAWEARMREGLKYSDRGPEAQGVNRNLGN